MGEITSEAGYKIALERIRATKETGVINIDLSGLSLVTLPAELWGLNKLKELDIGVCFDGGFFNINHLITLPSEIGQLSNLTSLDLSLNRLTSLPAEIGQLSNLTSLEISGNQLASLPAEIGQLSNLTSLDLSGNQLASLPAEIGQLTNLTSLDLSRNQLASLPAEIGQLTNLTSLEISSDQLTSLPAEIGQLTNLTSLEISSDQLTGLPAEIWQLTNLTSLEISSGELTSLPAEIGQLTSLTSLKISSDQLTSLPAEIGQLTNLTSLEISCGELTSLPAEIGQLTKLTSLDLVDMPLTSLPAEIGKITNLKKLRIDNYNSFWDEGTLFSFPLEILQLTNLTSLDLPGNLLTSLPAEIGQLTDLTSLCLNTNQLTSLPAEIWRLTKLTSLDLSHNLLPSLSTEIGQLVNLTHLDIQGNQLISLPVEIGKLIHLKNLLLSNRDDRDGEYHEDIEHEGNQIARLPTQIQRLKSLKTLDLRDNALDIPPEILGQLNKPQSILDYYFARQKKPLNEVKVILVGQGSVGKTSLVQRILHNTFDVGQGKTVGISISRWQTNFQSKAKNQQSKIKLNIWDFGGQEIMHATHRFFFTIRSLYLLVIDNRLTLEGNNIDYWLKIIEAFGSDVPVLIVGNKSDQHPLDIDSSVLMKKYPKIVGLVETSAATGAGIEELITAITEQVSKLPHVRDLLPETWFNVKEQLEERREKTNFINHDDYVKLCVENDITDETSQRTLLGFLHDLGVVLHFQDEPRLEALGILNPQWVTNGVYKIINAKSLFENRGVLTLAMLNEILNLPEYPRDKRLFIVDMMKKFELCFDLEHDKTFLVPDLLPKDEPTLDFHGILVFEYHYPVLPSSVMTRFIVRMNQKIDNDQVWRSGVLLKIGDNRALVKADTEDRTVRIAIDGLEHTRRDALSAIRYQLDEIHASIKGLNPEKFVPVPGAIHAKPLKYEYLLKMERAGQETTFVEDADELKEVNISQMLNGVESEYQRKQYGNVTNIHVGGNVGGHLVVGDNNDVQS